MSEDSTHYVDPRELPEGQEYPRRTRGHAPNGDPITDGDPYPEPGDPAAPLKVNVDPSA